MLALARAMDYNATDSVDDNAAFDVAVIGAGVAGLYAVYCCGISGLTCCLIDSSMCVGGQCSVLYPEKLVYGVPGFAENKAKEFIKQLAGQCLGYADKLFLGEQTSGVAKTSQGFFEIETDKRKVKSKNLIIATGIGNMTPNVPISVKGVKELEGKTDFIQYYCMKLDIYKNKKVIIAGGGDSAVDFAINISSIAEKVYLIHRKNKLNCEQIKIKELEYFVSKGVLEIVLENQIIQIGEKNSNRFVETDKKLFDVDYVVFCYGFLPNGKAINGLSELGLKEKNGLIEVDINTMETAVENCYAAGDIVNYPNKKKNIVPCYFEADRAVRSIKAKLSKGE